MNIFAFVVSLGLFLGGLALMAYSFSTVGFEAVMFVGGILVVGVSIAIPAHVLKRIDG